MSDLVLTFSPETMERLMALAPKMGRSFEECVQLALSEFLATWEEHLRTVADMEEPDQRPVLRAVND